MSIFVLVHGAFHGGWCWEKVVPLLEKQGHRALAVDLPGHGSNQAPMETLTLESYVNYVLGMIDAQSEPVVLVGHSLGGLTIATVAERRPERIRKLVYLCAAMLRPGEVMIDVAAHDTESLTRKHQQASPDGSYSTIARDAVKQIFYGDCSDQDVARAADRLVPQSMAMRRTPLPTSMERWGRVPRLYIHCLRDRAITIAQQRRFVTAAPCPTAELDTDHSPFYSAPAALAEVLIAAA